MSDTVYFDKKSFNKGVNDALTLRPIRQVMTDFVKNTRTSETKVGHKQKKHGRREQEITKKAG